MGQSRLGISALRQAIIAAIYMGRNSIFQRPIEQGMVVECAALDEANPDCPPLFCVMKCVEDTDFEPELRPGHEIVAVTAADVAARRLPTKLYAAVTAGLRLLVHYRLRVVTVEQIEPANLTVLLAAALARAASPLAWSRHSLCDGEVWNWDGLLPHIQPDAAALLQLVWLEERTLTHAGQEYYTAEIASSELATLTASALVEIAPPRIIGEKHSLWLYTVTGRDDPVAAQLEACPLYTK